MHLVQRYIVFIKQLNELENTLKIKHKQLSNNCITAFNYSKNCSTAMY